MDLDWAADEVITDSLDLLAEHGVEATLFMTHSAPVGNSNHELAIHPHFSSLDLDSHIRERMSCFPEAKGTRSHLLFDSYKLQPIYSNYGLRYQSNVLKYKQHNIAPYRISPTIIEFPIFFMDNIYIIMEGHNPSFTIEELSLHKPGLKVFDFHPIHIFLNSENLERYEAAKVNYHDPRMLLKQRNTTSSGIRSLFIELLKYLKTNNIKPALLTNLVHNMGANA